MQVNKLMTMGAFQCVNSVDALINHEIIFCFDIPCVVTEN